MMKSDGFVRRTFSLFAFRKVAFFLPLLFALGQITEHFGFRRYRSTSSTSVYPGTSMGLIVDIFLATVLSFDDVRSNVSINRPTLRNWPVYSFAGHQNFRSWLRIPEWTGSDSGQGISETEQPNLNVWWQLIAASKSRSRRKGLHSAVAQDQEDLIMNCSNCANDLMVNSVEFTVVLL